MGLFTIEVGVAKVRVKRKGGIDESENDLHHTTPISQGGYQILLRLVEACCRLRLWLGSRGTSIDAR